MQVYLITNKNNGMQYVGQTVRTLERRWGSHVSVALRGKGSYLAHTIKAHGPEQFTVEPLHVCGSNHGHEWTAENTYIHPNGTTRSCRACKDKNSAESNVINKDKRNKIRREHRKFLREIREGRVAI